MRCTCIRQHGHCGTGLLYLSAAEQPQRAFRWRKKVWSSQLVHGSGCSPLIEEPLAAVTAGVTRRASSKETRPLEHEQGQASARG